MDAHSWPIVSPSTSNTAGGLAEGMVTDHICENKACVNPDHLRELRNWQNLRRPHIRDDAEQERRRTIWREANSRRRTYSPSYVLGGEEIPWFYVDDGVRRQ